MDLMQMILNANGGGAVRQLSSQFGLGEDQTVAALQSLLPALAGGFQRNAASEGGIESLLGALSGGGHDEYLDDPASLADPETIADGNGILGHVFGSKDVSRQVASRASAQTGIGADVLKQMLPMVAALAMGALAKGSAARGMAADAPAGMGTGGAADGILGMLTPLLDRNQDGSVADDILGIAGRFLSGR